MYLTLDIGNTRSKFARFDDSGNLLDSGVWEGLKISEDYSAVCVANVTDSKPLIETINTPVVWMNARLKLPFTVAYKTPETLGVDRLAAAAGAAYFVRETDAMVVDAGTCLKFEYL